MSLDNRLANIKDKFTYIKHDISLKTQRKEELEKKLSQLSSQRTLLKKVDAAMEELVRRRTRSSVQQIEDLVNQGLFTIFEQAYKFKIETVTKRNNMHYEFYLYENGEQMDIMSSKGGGPISIISIILRIVVILLLDLEPFLVLDESLAQLSPEYIDNAAKFLKDLGKRLNFTIIMVSHSHEFMEYGDAVYKIRKLGNYANFERVDSCAA